MIDGVPADQFYQFIASSSRTSRPIHLSFPHHHHHHHHHGVSIASSASAASAAAPPVITPTPTQASTPAFLGCFDLHPSSHQTLEAVQPHEHHHHGGLHNQLHHQSPPAATASKNDEGRNLEMEEEGSISAAAIPIDPWSNDEVLALLRIRSSMENWFPVFTWEHVSRKLGEHGYQRSADKCKEKFDEESRHFNSMSYSKNYRFLSDLDELYHDDNHPQVNQALGKEKIQQEEDKMDLSQQQEETENVVTANPSQENDELLKESMRSKQRKRKYKFEMFKGFCGAVVKKIVAHQGDLHNKLIEDIFRREAECIAREEAWKCQEMDRINKEIEMRAQEQLITSDRQAKIVDLLKKFTSGSHADHDLMKKIEDFWKVTKSSSSVTSSSEILLHNPIETASSMSNISHQNPTLPPSSSRETTPLPQNHHHINLVIDSSTPQAASSSAFAITSQIPHKNAHAKHVNPISSAPSFAPKASQKAGYIPNDQRGEKVAVKRWPRDEVQALINLKCSHTNNFGDDHKEGTKGPLWERISQAMLELGYKRSAKRCKEKWENINKYFRKTKDSNKKRSLESRTCPYFHQLSTLYNQGKPVNPSDVVPENCPSLNTYTVPDNSSETAR